MSTATTPEDQAARVAAVFERIHREQMAGLPLLNAAIGVETLGFQRVEGRLLGMLVTPWMMSLLVFPHNDDEWRSMSLGDKQTHAFPGGSYRFLVNAVDDLGVFQMHSVHSPMFGFSTHAEAVAEATGFLERMLTPAGDSESQEDQVDETLLGRILRGEKLPRVDEAVRTMQMDPVDIGHTG